MNTPTSLLSSQARLATEMPSRYLQQLCKHFQHKLPVSFDPQRGRIEFKDGICELEAADAGTLLLRVAAANETGIAALENVVARHLARFAYREQPEFQWERGV